MKLKSGQYLLFARTAYMRKYKGLTEDDKPYGGHGYVEETGKAHEKHNFLPYKNKFSGYSQVLSLNTKKLLFNVMRGFNACYLGGAENGIRTHTSLLPQVLNFLF